MSVYLSDEMAFKVHFMFMYWFQRKTRRGVDEYVTMATLVPEGDTLNSCTSFCAKVLSNKKFLAPTVLVLGIANESCIRGGKPDAAK